MGIMARKLFVGGLSWNTTDDGLRRAFEPFGDVREATVIRDRDSGRSRGFGFITFVSRQEAQKALEELSGASLDGRQIRVNEAIDRRREEGSGFGGGGGGRDGYSNSGRGRW